MMDYDILKLEGKLAKVQHEIELFRGGLDLKVCPFGPWTVEYATIYLKLLERKEEGLTAVLLWAKSKGPYQKANGLEYDQVLYGDAQAWVAELPDWWKTHDDLIARVLPTRGQKKASPTVGEIEGRNVWKGTQRDWVRFIIAEKKKDVIKADSDEDAVYLSAPNYDWEKKPGEIKPMNARVAWQNWLNLRGEGKFPS